MSDKSETLNFTSGKIATIKILRFSTRILLYALLIFFLVIFAFPFYYMTVMATLQSDQIYDQPPHLIYGENLGENMIMLLESQRFFYTAIFHSIAIAVLGTSMKVFFCAIGGYGFAKYNFKGKNPLFMFLLVTLMMPGFVNIIPVYKMIVSFGWINTYWPFLLPGMANAFGIFLMRQYIQESIPMDILDAARIDGVGEFRMILMIVLPLIRPAVAVLGTITFIGHWNDFMGPLLFLPAENMYTLPLALVKMQAGMGNRGGHGSLMLANTLTVLPLLVVFVFFSKQIIRNLTAGSVKG
ncbi:MAG: carbohydrate ABC transporter permease [Spirochaetales bacterium]|nr:carbohydrate ABC transporter permease [Spirochaetales bacterium]